MSQLSPLRRRRQAANRKRESLLAMTDKPPYISIDGNLVSFEEAKVHVLAPAIAYGATVFEGVRRYWSARMEDCMLFRLDEHLERLEFAMKVMRFDTTLDAASMKQQVIDLVRANGQKDGIHIRILVYVSEGGT